MDDRFVFGRKEEPKNEVLTETFGQKLKRMRKEMKLTQAEFSKVVGINRVHVCLYERDQVLPSTATLEWICKALGVTATEMLGF